MGNLKEEENKLKKKYSFDQYGRYAIIRDIINKNRTDDQDFKVLDVGGRGNIMKNFLSKDKVFYLDPFVDTKDKNFIKGDGCDIPLKSKSFDWVVSADVFEHIPPKKREQFLKENIRVSKLGVVLAAPFYSKEVEQAEVNANENYKILSEGQDHPWLKEHVDNGLPKEKDVNCFLDENNYSYQKLYNNGLFLWQILISITFYRNNLLAGIGGMNLNKILEGYYSFNYFYNTKIFPFDCLDPSYRKIYFIKKDSHLKDLTYGGKKKADVVSLEVATRLLNLMNKDLLRLSKDGRLARKDKKIDSLFKEINKNEETIKAMQATKFWRVREMCLRLLNKKNQ